MHGWIIDQDYLEPGSVEEGTLGPSTIPPIVAEKLREGHGEKFRLFDDDGCCITRAGFLGMTGMASSHWMNSGNRTRDALRSASSRMAGGLGSEKIRHRMVFPITDWFVVRFRDCALLSYRKISGKNQGKEREMNFSQEVQDRIAEEGDTITLGEWRRRNGVKIRVRYVDNETLAMAQELRRLQSSSAVKRNY